MSPLLRLALILVFGLLGLGVAQTVRKSRIEEHERATAAAREALEARSPEADSAFADSVLEVAGPQNVEMSLAASTLPPPDRDPARIARTLGAQSAGTYLAEMLIAHDSMNYRWPDRQFAPMRVWVQELPVDSAGYEAGFPQLVRDAFTAWSDAGVPIHFTFVRDSARGEILVTWTDRFDAQMTGRTRWSHDRHGWIVGGSILIALHQFDGRALGRVGVRAIALHEVGHLIGLDHSGDARDIMASFVRVPELSEADRATARLVYALPPGSLKQPAPH